MAFITLSPSAIVTTGWFFSFLSRQKQPFAGPAAPAHTTAGESRSASTAAICRALVSAAVPPAAVLSHTTVVLTDFAGLSVGPGRAGQEWPPEHTSPERFSRAESPLPDPPTTRCSGI